MFGYSMQNYKTLSKWWERDLITRHILEDFDSSNTLIRTTTTYYKTPNWGFGDRLLHNDSGAAVYRDRENTSEYFIDNKQINEMEFKLGLLEL